MPAAESPGFVVITYSSPKSIHTMRIPTRAWVEGGGGFASGAYPRWSDDALIEADAMVQALADELDDCLPTTHSIINYTIYTQASASAPPVPRYSAVINNPGTVVVPGWWEAVQATWNFRDTEFETMKVVLLDMDSANLFGKLVDVSSVANLNDVATQISSTGRAWASRNDKRPSTILSVTRTLNEKLRRAYGHTG